MAIQRSTVYLQSPFDDVWLTISLVLSQVFLPFKTCQASPALKQPVLFLSPTGGRAAFALTHALALALTHHGAAVAHASSSCVQGTHVQGTQWGTTLHFQIKILF